VMVNLRNKVEYPKWELDAGAGCALCYLISKLYSPFGY